MRTTSAAPAVPVEEITFFHNDAAGTPMLASDAKGNIIWRENSLPYGVKQSQSKAVGSSVGYTGKPFDDDTGLSYMNARYYDPVLGRFLAMDPVEFVESNVHSFNRYAYANNNPYRYIDPTGKAAETGWDGFNLMLGAASFTRNLAMHNYLGAAVDAGGLVIDGFATAVPGVPGGAAYGINAYRVAQSVKTKGAANFSRELQATDLGIKGAVQELKGNFVFKDGIATMRIDMIRGEIKNPLQVVSHMMETAKASGATSLRIEGTIANERLYNILAGRYGLTSNGATDLITIPLR